MKEGIVEKIKQSKPFMKVDIIIYFLSLVLVVMLFLIFVIFPQKTTATGFSVSLDGNHLLTYNSITKTYDLDDKFSHLVEVIEDDNKVNFKIYSSDEKTGFNLLVIDKISHTAYITESNCSNRKDCVHTSPIKDSGVIVCAPHKLKISPVTNATDNPTVG